MSSPHENEVEFFIELVPGGELTPQLHELQAGNEILMRKVAKGRFLRETSKPHKNHLLVSTVTGVAPYVSYIRSLVNDEREDGFPSGKQVLSAEWRKPVVGIRVPRGAREHGIHRTLAGVRADD